MFLCRHEPYDARSDCWSFGVLLVELLTQQKPYSQLYMTPVQIAIQVGGVVGRWSRGWLVVAVALVVLVQANPTDHCCTRPLQVADGSLHPQVPPDCHPGLVELLAAIFSPDPLERPTFGIIVARLDRVLHDVRLQAAAGQMDSLLGRWFKGAAASAGV